MRTTLDIADDVLFAAKVLARREKKSIGAIISEIARQSFARDATAQGSNSPDKSKAAVARERLAITAFGPCARAAL